MDKVGLQDMSVCLSVHRICQTGSHQWSISQRQVPGYINAKNAVADGMRISADGWWKKTCHRQTRTPSHWGKPNCHPAQFCWTSHPCPGIGDAQPRGVAGVEVLPEHHKPLKEHRLLLEGIWCCLWSKPAGSQGFPKGPRARCVRLGMSLPLHTV